MVIQEYYYFNGVWVHWGSVQFVQIIFFRCTWLVLTDNWYFFCIYLIWKRHKDKKTRKYSEKKEFIKERWEGPTFKLWRRSRDSTFKFWRGSWGSTFKLWGGFRVPGPRAPRSRDLESWSRFYTMSLLNAKFARYSLQKLIVAKNLSLLITEVARCYLLH